jgi:hypothetical protein
MSYDRNPIRIRRRGPPRGRLGPNGPKKELIEARLNREASAGNDPVNATQPEELESRLV